jgi:lysyl-tRNA synthetase class 1
MVAQAARFDEETVVRMLTRSGYEEVEPAAVSRRLRYARRWLERFAPEDVRFEVADRLPAEAAELSEPQRRFLRELAERLAGVDDGQRIHELIYEVAASVEEAQAAELFRAIYLALLGKSRGPRAGMFIATLGTEFCAVRFREAAGDAAP